MKPKRKWFQPPKNKSDILFINPEKGETKPKKSGTAVDSNWATLKGVIAAEPRVSSLGGKRSREKGRPDRKRKSGNKESFVKKRRRILTKASTDEKMTLSAEPAPTPTIWFDDVDPSLLEYVPDSYQDNDQGTTEKSGKVAETNKGGESESKLVKPASFEGLTKAVAMDCEMVGAGKSSLLARVSIVNVFGHCIYDTFVRPTEKVTDYRTEVSGVRPQDVVGAPSFDEVQKKVFSIVDKRILVGHALRNDFQVLYLSHPRKLIRDTARYVEFRKLFQGRTPSLKNLTNKLLDVRIQSGEHNSIEDARAAMRLYTMYKIQWEKYVSAKRRVKQDKQIENTEET